MVTSSVSDTKTYAETVSVDVGTYVVKVADYNGGDFKTATVTVNTNTIDSPNTLDNIIMYIVFGVIAIVGILVGTIYLKRRNMVK